MRSDGESLILWNFGLKRPKKIAINREKLQVKIKNNEYTRLHVTTLALPNALILTSHVTESSPGSDTRATVLRHCVLACRRRSIAVPIPKVPRRSSGRRPKCLWHRFSKLLAEPTGQHCLAPECDRLGALDAAEWRQWGHRCQRGDPPGWNSECVCSAGEKVRSNHQATQQPSVAGVG